jgi:hypothetical protein
VNFSMLRNNLFFLGQTGYPTRVIFRVLHSKPAVQCATGGALRVDFAIPTKITKQIDNANF